MQIKSTLLLGAIATGLTLPALADSERYRFDGFDRVEVSSGVIAEIVEGDDFSVTAEALRGNLSRLTIEQSRGTLRISRETRWGLLDVGKRDRFRVEITLPKLDYIAASSGSDVSLTVVGPDLRADASSGSTLQIDGIAGGDIRLDVSSGATLRIDGICDLLQAEASSGASIEADDLVCARGDLEASSGASLRAHLTEVAEVAASSGASIRLEGDAELISSEVRSAGSFNQN